MKNLFFIALLFVSVSCMAQIDAVTYQKVVPPHGFNRSTDVSVTIIDGSETTVLYFKKVTWDAEGFLVDILALVNDAKRKAGNTSTREANAVTIRAKARVKRSSEKQKATDRIGDIDGMTGDEIP